MIMPLTSNYKYTHHDDHVLVTTDAMMIMSMSGYYKCTHHDYHGYYTYNMTMSMIAWLI